MSKSLLSSLESLSETLFGSAHCTVMHSDAIVFLFYKTTADWSNFCNLQTGSLYFTPHILIHYSKPVIVFCYATPDWSIASLVSSLDFILKRTAYLHWHLPIKWLKNFIAIKKQQELKFLIPQNSLPAPSLHEQLLSVANESCSGRKKQQKQYPTHIQGSTSSSLLI